MVIVVLHFPMNHQVMLHMQKVIEKMLPQRKEGMQGHTRPIVQSAAFLSSRPWIIPFNIASFEDDQVVDVIQELPKEIVL